MSKSYEPGSAGRDCCCGNPECTDFEDRMAAWGIPLDEITTVEFKLTLPPTPGYTEDVQQGP